MISVRAVFLSIVIFKEVRGAVGLLLWGTLFGLLRVGLWVLLRVHGPRFV